MLCLMLILIIIMMLEYVPISMLAVISDNDLVAKKGGTFGLIYLKFSRINISKVIHILKSK